MVAQAAACRLIKYWEIRNKIFGERGFLPMVMTGHGALTEEDVTGMDVGATLLLGSYTQGQTVLLHDKSRLDGHPDTPAVMVSANHIQSSFFQLVRIVVVLTLCLPLSPSRSP